jgi:hypothetical protein
METYLHISYIHSLHPYKIKLHSYHGSVTWTATDFILYSSLQMYKYANTLPTTKIHGSYWAIFEDNNTNVIRLLLSITQSAVQTFADMVWLYREYFFIIRRLLMATVEQTALLLHSNQWYRLLCSAQPWNKKILPAFAYTLLLTIQTYMSSIILHYIILSSTLTVNLIPSWLAEVRKIIKSKYRFLCRTIVL